MARLLALLVTLSLTGCGLMVTAKLRMPVFGATFDADIHAVAPTDEAKFIIYQDPDLDARLKFNVTINPWAYHAGYVFPGAFLETTRPPGILTFSSHHVWWDGNVPVGESFLWKIEPGEPPPAPEGITRTVHARLNVEATAGTVMYLRLKRTVTEGLEICAETKETVRMCPYISIDTKLEIVRPAEAQRELAGLRQTIFGKTAK